MFTHIGLITIIYYLTEFCQKKNIHTGPLSRYDVAMAAAFYYHFWAFPQAMSHAALYLVS